MKKTILVVDDDPIFLELVTQWLEKADFDVKTAANGVESLSVAEEHTPDLIILDILMPEMDGFATKILLSKIDKLKKIPVIFLTAIQDSREEQDYRMSIKEGFDVVEYFSKPVDPVKLIAAIKQTLNVA